VFGVVGAAAHVYRRRPATGAEELIGMTGHVVEWQDGTGRVHIHGETWSARADRTLRPNDTIRVVAMQGLTLQVEPT
jgi:membrane-bound serine protease (ClpP class)